MRYLYLACVIAIAVSFSPSTVWGIEMEEVVLPQPKLVGDVSVEEAIQGRRSVRSFAGKEVSLEQAAQLLWACQGITDSQLFFRAAPSAGALYPLEVYLAKSDGLFRYVPSEHKLTRVLMEDVRKDLAAAAHNQAFVHEADIVIVIGAVYGRVTSRYGDRGIRYTDMEAGHAAENVFLQAVALGLDSVAVGAFTDETVAKVWDLPSDVKPLYLLPVGYKK